MKGKWLVALTLVVLPALTHISVGQSANPEQLHIARGEANWVTPRGSKNVSLEQCDLGEGPGKLEGAYARLPRYFSDADRVMDLEQRLLWCMEKLQGLDTAELAQRPFPGAGRISEMEDLVVFIAGKSNGMKIEAQTAHPKEREMLGAGEAMFYRRSAIMDFSCDSCHGPDGKRMRWARLPQLSKPGAEAQAVMGSWPVYGIPQRRIRTLQYRLWECYRQMRMPAPEYASDGLTALTLFLESNATGGTIQVPSIKR